MNACKVAEIIRLVLKDRGYTDIKNWSDSNRVLFTAYDKDGYRSKVEISNQSINANAGHEHAVIDMIQDAVSRNENVNADMRWMAECNIKSVMAIKPPPHPNSKLAKMMVRLGELHLFT